MEAKIKPDVIKAEVITCATFVGVAGLNMAIKGWILTSCPFNKVKPCGAFIKAFTVEIKKADIVEPITMGISNKK